MLLANWGQLCYVVGFNVARANSIVMLKGRVQLIGGSLIKLYVILLKKHLQVQKCFYSWFCDGHVFLLGLSDCLHCTILRIT